MKRMIFGLVLIAGCAPAIEPEPAPDPVSLDGLPVALDDPADAGDTAARDPSENLILLTCGADKVYDTIGTPLQTAQPRLPDTARIILPADVVTQDYNNKRMNVFVNDTGTITRIDCG